MPCSSRPRSQVAGLSVDSGAAEQAPGVLRILTAGNFPRLDLEKVGSPPLGQKLMPLQDDRVLYQGQAIALVIAETLEQAEEAARLVRAKYEATPPQVFGFGEARLPQGGMSLAPHEEMSGDIDAGLAEADVMVEGEYTLPSRHHNPMEPMRHHRGMVRRPFDDAHGDAMDLWCSLRAGATAWLAAGKYPRRLPIHRRWFWLQRLGLAASGHRRSRGTRNRPSLEARA